MRRAVAAIALVALAACSSDDGSANAEPEPVDERVDVASDWPTAGFDLANTRAVASDVISSESVDDLDEMWRVELAGLGALSTVPIVVDGTIYLAGGSGAVSAIDLASGDVEWTSEASGLNIGPFGVAVDDERVYSLDGANGVLALDRATGERLWSTDVTTTPTLGIDIQPIVVDGLVLVSSVPVSVGGIYTGGDRGVVHALDAATGDIVWSFDTVLGDDLWGDPAVNSGGGAWYPPAVDLERGVVYVGVANPAPFPGTSAHPNGTSRPGDNLYTNSLVALDLHTGELRWYHQVTPHDLFDRDQVHALIAGDVVVSAGKSGIVVGIDPDTGSALWRTEVGDHQNDDLTALDGPTTVAPGTYGGVLTPPATADGIVYLPVLNSPVELKPDETAYFGASMGVSDGEVVAVHASTGAIVWATDVPGDPLGGATVVGDLVFTTLVDGELVALRREDGEIVLRRPLDGGTNGWMAVAGDRLLVPVGNADPPALVAFGL